MTSGPTLQLANSQDLETLVKWQRSLKPLRVDLVCDFAGSDLFAILGESLVAHCVAQADVDFEDGFQVLHAVHAVESFIQKLKERGCNFQVIWFSSHQQLAAAPNADPDDHYKYHLLRAILCQHLNLGQNAKQPTPEDHAAHIGSQVSYVFTAVNSDCFKEHIKTHCLHFVMCLRGRSLKTGERARNAVGRAVAMRQFAELGYSLAFLDHIDFKSNKVYVDVVGSSRALTPLQVLEASAPLGKDAGWHRSLQLDELSLRLTREYISLLACAALLKTTPGQATATCVAAILLHVEVMQRCNISQRSLRELTHLLSVADRRFLRDFSNHCIDILAGCHDQGLKADGNSYLCDLLDGRLFSHVLQALPELAAMFDIREQAGFLLRLSGVDILPHLHSVGDVLAQRSTTCTDFTVTEPSSASREASDEDVEDPESSGRSSTPESDTDASWDTLQTISHRQSTVLPFSNPVTDEYLNDIRLNIDETCEGSTKSAKIFEEISHWHNSKKALDAKHAVPLDWRARRRNQRFMADTIAYSASLTNASGKNIDPEVIIVQKEELRGSKKARAREPAVKQQQTNLPLNRHAKAAKLEAKGGKAKALEAARAIQVEKEVARSHAVVNFFARKCHDFESVRSLVKRYANANRYLQGLSDSDRHVIGGDALLFICSTIAQLLGRPPYTGKDLSVLALLRSHVVDMSKLPLSPAVIQGLEPLAHSLQLKLPAAAGEVTRSLPFNPGTSGVAQTLELPGNDSIAFQLQHCGPYLERSFGSAPDPRVPFNPDAWQREVLDAIDADKSLFVVAPTSAGKTFISFYAMKKVLQSNDDDVLVYVAPTKALVNQIAAEVQARFSKSYQKDGRSVWAIHTRDYRVNNATGCQVLVTVPHILQIMLLAPSNASQPNSWSRRVKRIIFDEVHTIGQAGEGIVWEQLLLLAPCPIIALSATVGNPLEFRDWLAASQEAKGFELKMVIHSTRYSDLRKFIYQGPVARDFEGLASMERLPIPGLDADGTSSDRFVCIHPIASMVNKNVQTLNDLSMEPRDCLDVWQAMSKHSDSQHINEQLRPERALQAIVKKSDVVVWEAELKSQLGEWVADPSSPFVQVQHALTTKDIKPVTGFKDVVKSSLDLLIDLRAQGALPAILFNYDREGCENIMFNILTRLQEAEQDFRFTDREWAAKLQAFEAYKVQIAKRKTKAPKAKGGRRDEDDLLTKAERTREEACEEVSPWASFDPDAPIERFSFADPTTISKEELHRLIGTLRYTPINQRFVDAIRRGLGVHHAGMNRQYRQVVEILFRKGFLTAIVATGTLALGLNMPCKTVVFAGDSVFLTALNYRQASGRAGRRGFDLLGNVVFHGIPQHRAMEIMSSRLPDLRGQFPVSATLVLRLFSLLHGTDGSKYAVKAFHSLLTQTRLYLGGPSSKMSIKHHLRFSIEYLQRQHLLSADGAPLNFCGLVSHLYFTENAAFAFHSLLKKGYLHQLCSTIVQDSGERSDLLCELVTVLSHLFCRIPCHRFRDQEWLRETVHRSPSLVLLPRMPREAEDILREHNNETLGIFREYARTFVVQHLADTPDDVLPFTGLRVGAQKEIVSLSASDIPALPPPVLRSHFAALSGFSDSFKTICELCQGVRSGVFLEEDAVPFITVYPHETKVPFNAYILDFFKHGDMEALVRDNGIKRGDVWFRLKDFSLILATIVTSLANFLGKSTAASTDMAMIDVQDVGDVLEEAHDFDADQDENEDLGSLSAATTNPSPRGKEDGKKSKLADSWEDEEAEETDDADSSEDDGIRGDLHDPAGDGKGLLRVYQAFQMLQQEFETKFRKVWA